MKANVTVLCKFNEQQELDTHSPHQRSRSQKGDKAEHSGALNSPSGLLCVVVSSQLLVSEAHLSILGPCSMLPGHSPVWTLVWVEREVMQGSERGEAFCFLGIDV